LAQTFQGEAKPLIFALGKGEGIQDLVPFNAKQYSTELFN
jgi:fused signal recognition particle receptor